MFFQQTNKEANLLFVPHKKNGMNESAFLFSVFLTANYLYYHRI